MINIPPIRSSGEIHSELLPDVAKTWKVGQVLNATAETNADAQGKALLRVGQYILETRTPIPLNTGDQLKLLVKTLGDTPLLNIQTTAIQTNSVTQNLRSFISHQQDITPLLKLGQRLINNPSIPTDIRQQLGELLNKLPTIEQATKSNDLKQLFQNSGIFLENKLLQPQAGNIEQDLKFQLLRLSNQIRNTIPVTSTETRPQSDSIQFKDLQQAISQFIKGDITLKQFTTVLSTLPKGLLSVIQQAFVAKDSSQIPRELITSFTQLLIHIQQQPNSRQTLETISSLLKTLPLLQELNLNIDNALAKITSQQLTPLTREGDNLLLLLFGLPLKDKTDIYLIQFRLEQEKQSDDPSSSSWVVTLNFDFKNLGPIQARLHLIDNHISTRFLAEKNDTANIIKRQIKLLETALEKIGLDVVSLDVSHGKADAPRELPDSIHILDEQA